MDMQRLCHEGRWVVNQRGVTAIVVALLLVVLAGFTALAIDVGHLVLARNELQNAADAGALAGARFLYTGDGTAVNEEANQIAYEAATANSSEKLPVEVQWGSGNTGDIQRGHWCFANRTFTPDDSLEPVDLWNVSTEELDTNLDLHFINAIKVVTRRHASPVASFFARIFGHHGFRLSAEAIGYIGFAGTLRPKEVDQPINICKQSIIYGADGFTCTTGRMIPSTEDTGGWTSFGQEEDGSCPPGGTNAQEVRDLVDTGCLGEGANPGTLHLGGGMTFNEGQIDTAFQKLMDCWEKNAGDPPTQPWKLTLPVVDCSEGGPTCHPLVGAVEVNIIWIIREGPQYNDPLHQKNDEVIPWEMSAPEGSDISNWSSSNPDAKERWNDFAQHFNLQTSEGLITWEWLKNHNVIKTIFFLPDCTPHELQGLSGGENFGILAKIPVLVK